MLPPDLKAARRTLAERTAKLYILIVALADTRDLAI